VTWARCRDFDRRLAAANGTPWRGRERAFVDRRQITDTVEPDPAFGLVPAVARPGAEGSVRKARRRAGEWTYGPKKNAAGLIPGPAFVVDAGQGGGHLVVGRRRPRTILPARRCGQHRYQCVVSQPAAGSIGRVDTAVVYCGLRRDPSSRGQNLEQ